jgi:hypothetical protein
MQEHAAFSEAPVGVVTHYWPHLGVAGVHLTAPLDVGDHIHVVGHTSNFEQQVSSMEIDHHQLPHADENADVAIAVVDHAREHDTIYRMVELGKVGSDETGI